MVGDRKGAKEMSDYTKSNLKSDHPDLNRSYTASSDELLYTELLVGREVTDIDGNFSGKIKTFLFSRRSGHIEFVIIRQTAPKNTGKRYKIIPYEVLEYRGPCEPIIIHASGDMLAKAPGFRKAELHEVYTRHYDLIASYWGNYFGSPRNPVIFN